MPEPTLSEEFDFALWKLNERDDPKPMERLLARLRETRTGRQIAAAEKLLAERGDAPAVPSE